MQSITAYHLDLSQVHWNGLPSSVLTVFLKALWPLHTSAFRRSQLYVRNPFIHFLVILQVTEVVWGLPSHLWNSCCPKKLGFHFMDISIFIDPTLTSPFVRVCVCFWVWNPRTLMLGKHWSTTQSSFYPGLLQSIQFCWLLLSSWNALLLEFQWHMTLASSFQLLSFPISVLPFPLPFPLLFMWYWT